MGRNRVLRIRAVNRRVSFQTDPNRLSRIHQIRNDIGVMGSMMGRTRGGGMEHGDGDHGAMPGMGGMQGMAMDLNDIDFDACLADDRTLANPEVVRIERGGRVKQRIINAAAATVLRPWPSWRSGLPHRRPERCAGAPLEVWRHVSRKRCHPARSFSGSLVLMSSVSVAQGIGCRARTGGKVGRSSWPAHASGSSCGQTAA